MVAALARRVVEGGGSDSPSLAVELEGRASTVALCVIIYEELGRAIEEGVRAKRSVMRCLIAGITTDP